jgi:hypothetical protein
MTDYPNHASFTPMARLSRRAPDERLMPPASGAASIDVESLSRGSESSQTEVDEEWFESLCEAAKTADSSTSVRHDTPNDTWGVMLFIIAKDLGDLAAGVTSGIHSFRMLFAFVVLIINLLLQITVLWWVYTRVVQESVMRIQGHYYAFHVECFDNSGTFNATGWSNFQHKDKLCQSGMAQPQFLLCVLVIWTLAMLQEFRENFNLHRHMMSLPALPSTIGSHDQVIENDETGQRAYLLVALTPTSRILVYVLIIIPKYLIIVVLLGVGWEWLTASESLENLILNSLALTFITTIDELLFNSVFPERLHDKVNALKVINQVQQYASKVEREQGEHSAMTFYYGRSALFVILASIALYLYVNFFQDVIPGYMLQYKDDLQDVCGQFGAAERPRCSGFFRHNHNDCFPYGPRTKILQAAARSSPEM